MKRIIYIILGLFVFGMYSSFEPKVEEKKKTSVCKSTTKIEKQSKKW